MSPDQAPFRKPRVRTWTAIVLAALFATALNSSRADASESAYAINGDHVMIINATLQEYGEAIDDLWGPELVPDYRIEWINIDWYIPTEGPNGEPAQPDSGYFAVNAILVKHTEDFKVAHFFGLGPNAMQQAINDSQDNGWEMMQVEAYATPDGIRYAYIAYDRPGPKWDARIELLDGVFDTIIADMPAEMNWVNRCETKHPDFTVRHSVLFKEDKGKSFSPPNSMEHNDLQNMRQELKADGYVMTSLEVVNVFPYPARFIPVFKTQNMGKYLKEGHVLDIASVVESVNDSEMLGLQPILISNVRSDADLGQGWQAQPLSFALWRQPEPPPRAGNDPKRERKDPMRNKD